MIDPKTGEISIPDGVEFTDDPHTVIYKGRTIRFTYANERPLKECVNNVIKEKLRSQS